MGKSSTSFINGQIPWNKGKCFQKGIIHRSAETKKKMGEQKLGVNNPMWKGDKVSYKSLHCWVRRHKEKKLCICGKAPYDLANISRKYLRDINDYVWLCRKCHMLSDGRIEKLILVNKNRRI